MTAGSDEARYEAAGQVWLVSWFPATDRPEGCDHGAAAVCLSGDGSAVIVSPDGVAWDVPAGRPDPGETPIETMRREVLEEACAIVTDARCLGFVRSRCIAGREEGLTLVRAFWLATVEVKPWAPKFEIRHRDFVAPAHLIERLGLPDPLGQMLQRACAVAGLRVAPEPQAPSG